MSNFQFPAGRRRARATRIVDGDTFDAVIDLGFGVAISHRIRLAGIDTPELNSKNPDEVQRALAAKGFATDWLTIAEEWPLALEVSKGDKYGRFIARVFRHPAKEEELGPALMAKGLARPYTGG